MPREFLLDNATAYSFWAYADAASQFTADTATLGGADLLRVVLDRTADWAPGLRELIGGSDPQPSTQSGSAARPPSAHGRPDG